MARSDKHSGGFNCKYGNNCVKFNPNNIENASRLRRIMSNLSDRELFSWELIPELFGLFKAEHSKIAKVSKYDDLTNEWKKHFRDYIIIRSSCNNGSLYKNAYDYYSSINMQKNKVSNYDTVVDDSAFYYNYADKEDFIENNSNTAPIKSYLSKMYAEEVQQNSIVNHSRRVLNMDHQLLDTPFGKDVIKGDFIVIRAKVTYEPKGFTYSPSEFGKISKLIKSGDLTAYCGTKQTSITNLEPSAASKDLLNRINKKRCSCGKYHVNQLAYTVLKSAADKYYVANGKIYFNGILASEKSYQKHYLTRDSQGNVKLYGENKGKHNSSNTNNNNSSNTESGSAITDISSSSLSSSSLSSSSSIGDGTEGMYGLNEGGDTKDLALFINGSTSSSTTVSDTGSNAIIDKTNAETNAKNNDYAANPSNPLNATIYNNSNAPSSAAVSQKPNNQNQNASTSNGQTTTDDSQIPEDVTYTGTTSSSSGKTTQTTTMDDVNAAINNYGTTVYGESTKDLPNIEFIPGFPNSDSSHKTSILGIPMMYNSLCDPNGRVYSETTMMDLPIIYMEPGRGKLNNTIDDEDLMKELKSAYKSNDEGGGIKTARTSEDLRALSFENAFVEFMDYFQNICSVVYGNMGLGVFKWQDSLNANNNIFTSFKNGYKGTTTDVFLDRSLMFFADTATSISDSFSNEFSDAPLTSSVNNFGVLVRNLKMMTVQDAAQAAYDGDLATGIVGNFQDQNDTGKNRSTLTSIINDILSKGATLWNGSQLLFPQVWNDSRHDRSYSLSFKFFSPYGNKEAIFQKVYLPVLALMTLTLPRMDSISGYAQPFYVRINAPGYSN